MNVKKALRTAFAPPEPQRREKFIKAIPDPKPSYFAFLLSQICYIRKRIWIFSMGLLLLSLGAACAVPRDELYAVWVISAAIPFLALMTATEISRSDLFCMSEMEAGCRFSLPQLTGARMILLGACNFTLIPLIAVLLGVSSPLGIFKTALYLFTPYLTVNGISLVVLSKVNGVDGIYISAAATVGVSLAGALPFGRMVLDEHLQSAICAALCVVGAIVIAVQLGKRMRGNFYGIKN